MSVLKTVAKDDNNIKKNTMAMKMSPKANGKASLLFTKGARALGNKFGEGVRGNEEDLS